MRKAIALVITLILSLLCILPFAQADGIPIFSTDAVRQYCDLWNGYYIQYEPILHCGFSLSDDNKTVSMMHITYNEDQQEMNYNSAMIPSKSYIHFIYSTINDVYGFCVFSEDTKPQLENAIIYTDDRVINDINIGYSHEDDLDMWSITLYPSDVLDLFSKDHFTLKWTIDGKSEIIDISKEKNSYLYEMVFWLLGVRMYSNTTNETYRDISYLPGGAGSSNNDVVSKGYSFQEDYEKVDLSAKSLFYVETYDSHFNILSTASGFVFFDEHLFVTNQHVIEDASYLKVCDDDDNTYVIDKVVMSDKKHDLAILLFPEGKKYNALEAGIDAELKRGQPIVTIGSPKGLHNTVSYGNISAFPVIDDIKYIQFTAPISHGSSGGCLFDDTGKVIGITSAVYTEGQNLNFAIPINYVQSLYSQWDKSSYEPLGTKYSWDIVGTTPTPTPTPSPTPVPPTADTLPVGTFLNRYGVITRLVNFRSAPSASRSSVELVLNEGKYVYLISNVRNTQNEIWSKIKVNGKEGYVKSEYIYAISQDESDMYDKAQNSPAPVYTATPAPTSVPNTADTLPVGIFLNRYGIIANYVNFRSGPSTDDPVSGLAVKAGEYVYLISNVRNSKNEIWSKVNVNGKEGYIKSEYIYVISIIDSSAHNNSQSSPAPVYTATPTPSPSPTPTLSPTPTPQIVNVGAESLYKILLDESEVTVYKGYPITINPKVVSLSDGKEVKNMPYSWIMSNSNIAEISNGKLQGYTVGDTVITCQLDTDKQVRTFLFVHVAQPVDIISHPSDTITLSCDSTENSSYKLSIQKNPPNATFDKLTYVSSNKNVASVDNSGIVTAISPGSTKITVTAHMNGLKTQPKCTVNITVIRPVETIKDDTKSIEIDIQQSQQLTPVIIPNNATNKKLTWTSSNESVATVNANGLVRGIKAGSCTITAKSQDSSSASITYKVQVIQPITNLKNTGNYYSLGLKSLDLNKYVEIIPKNATNKKLLWKIERIDKQSTFNPSTSDGVYNFKNEGLYKITASVKGNSKINTSFELHVLPKDGNTLYISDNCYGEWYDSSNDHLKIRVEVENMSYGYTIKAFELYVYAVDTWNNKIYGDKQYYYLTTNKDVNPGRRVYSDYFILPQRSKISKVYFGIHKVKLWNDKIVTYSSGDIDFACWTIK